MRYLKLTVAYDGTQYVGWQVQPNGVSIQQRLQEAWAATTQEQAQVVASGRTDAGVHAIAQVCSVRTEAPHSLDTLRRALNAHTPDDISVLDVQNAPVDFHAIRDATAKTYRYQIQHGRNQNPTINGNHWHVRKELDIGAITKAASYLTGELDFASFQAAGADRKTTIRHLSELRCDAWDEGYFKYLHISLTSNGFLYNMVRNIVGTLVRVGQGSEPAAWVQDVLAQKNRSVAGQTAPAHALTLVNVEYDGIEFSSDSQ